MERVVIQNSVRQGLITQSGRFFMRSSEWFNGNDETAVSHRVVMRSVGLEVPADNKKPIIGIADSSSDLNPCNLPLRALVDDVKAGILEAGGIPVAFPVISLGEDLMKASAMLYRNLLSIEIEENLRSYPLDGVVLLANCDKSVPGALMGALSANLPTIMVTAGAQGAPLSRLTQMNGAKLLENQVPESLKWFEKTSRQQRFPRQHRLEMSSVCCTQLAVQRMH